MNEPPHFSACQGTQGVRAQTPALANPAAEEEVDAGNTDGGADNLADGSQYLHATSPSAPTLRA